MEGKFYADVTRLQQHSSTAEEQIRMARLLREQLCMAKQLAAPVEVTAFDEMIAEAERIIQFLILMSETIENMSEELSWLSLQVGKKLEDSLSETLLKR